MQVWNIPGLALVIVKEDKVLLAKGYGVREIGKPDKVDEHTLFAIGSNTKSFTATAIGLLVQDGKIAWDDPVTKYIPDFRLFDANTTQLITIRDLLCHRSGLGTWAGDVLLLSNYPAEEIVQRLRHIQPEFSFRAGYGYSNLMFITAGLNISTVSGMSWDDFILQRIFKPLGMTDSVTNPRYFGERAKGVKRASEAIGNGSAYFAMHNKGLTFAGHSARGMPGFALGYASGPRGGSHHDSRPTGERTGLVPRETIEGKGEYTARINHLKIFTDSLIVCHLTERIWGPLDVTDSAVRGLNAATGMNMTLEEARTAAERIWNLIRAFAVREGYRREHDQLPARFLEEPIPSGALQRHGDHPADA